MGANHLSNGNGISSEKLDTVIWMVLSAVGSWTADSSVTVGGRVALWLCCVKRKKKKNRGSRCAFPEGVRSKPNALTANVLHIEARKGWMQACKCREWLTQNYGGVCHRLYANLQYTLIPLPVPSSSVSSILSVSLPPSMSALPPHPTSLSLISLLANTHAHPDKPRLKGGGDS